MARLNVVKVQDGRIAHEQWAAKTGQLDVPPEAGQGVLPDGTYISLDYLLDVLGRDKSGVAEGIREYVERTMSL